ncbi:hypothetical protein V8D89_004531 [Ganoderma adspersum]
MTSVDGLYLLTINEFLEAVATLPDEVLSSIWHETYRIRLNPRVSSQVAFVWPTNWNSMKFLFLANKYMALGDALFEAMDWYLTGTILSEIILVARTLALWGFDKCLTSFVLLAALQVIAVGGSIHITLCIVSSSRDSRTLQTLYRDGTAFWFIVLAFSIANFVVMFIAPVELSNCMHPALCTRVFLNLRKAAAKECPTNSEFTMLTTLAFDHPAESDAHFVLEEPAVAGNGGEEAVTGGE